MQHISTTSRSRRHARLRIARVIWLALLLVSAAGMAATTSGPSEQPRTTRGTLMLSGDGVQRSLPAMRLGTDMDVTVSGSVTRVRVIQAFRNTSSHWLAGQYTYPLPDDGAVDSLKMVVGNRVIVGHIERREQARATYEHAAAAGRKAGLVEQQRPNLFSTDVANVGPGETVLIAIEYQAPVRQVDGTYSLRLPLVAGPRYVPPHTLTSQVEMRDAQAVTATPVLDPQLGEKINPVSITIHLDPGFMPADVTSRYHAIDIEGDGATRTVTLASGTVPADRDFELDWRSAASQPTVGVFSQRVDGQDYVMATIAPPAIGTDMPVSPREMIFVIDNSGSMGGASMREAKASLLHALATLRAQDRFNVIRFDDTTTRLFAQSVRATSDQLAIARRFTKALKADGGTEMLPALQQALAEAGQGRGESEVRQVIFLTDGAIANEKEMLAALGRDGSRSRVFMVGIGSAPNTYLMSRMAAVGRGTYTHVGTADEVQARMTRLLDTLRHPAVRNLSIRTSDAALELTPSRLPDLYAGEPLTVLGRSDRLQGTLTVDGFIGERHWSKTVALNDAQPSPAVAKRWARRRIQEIETERTLGHLDGAADEKIGQIGLRYALVTSQTSLVAVDNNATRPADVPLTREQLPINLPAGWDFDTLFGGAPAQRDDANDVSRPRSRLAPTESIDLPQTATGFAAIMARGLLMLSVGLFGLCLLRRTGGTL